jgi:hypothetical protein
VQAQLAPYLPTLRDVWLALLRDHAMLHTQPRGVLRAYRPHLYAPPAAAAARAQMERAWPAVLDAVVSLVAEADAWRGGRDGAASAAGSVDGGFGGADGGGGGAAQQPICARPHSEDFDVLLGLCVHRLTEDHADAAAAAAAAGDGHGPDPNPEASLRCLAALERLLLPGTYLSPAALPPAALLSLLGLLESLSAAPHAPRAVRAAVAALAAHLGAHLGPYLVEPGCNPLELLGAAHTLSPTPILTLTLTPTLTMSPTLTPTLSPTLTLTLTQP